MKNIIIRLPKKVSFIIDRLLTCGFEAYAVGGCVRDSILNKEPCDWDVCTQAQPGQIKKAFSEFRQIDAGIKHGTVAVIMDNEVFEITTYRLDGEYSDNRHPDTVSFTSLLSSDLARRDFTVNAMAYNDECGLVDPFLGLDDLNKGIIRCVGDANRRFCEDALRIMRALRFSASLNFKIEENTRLAAVKNKGLLNNIAAERINAELCKLVTAEGAYDVMDRCREVIAAFIPEISPMFDYEQKTVHHRYDLWRHSLRSMSCIEPTPLLRLAMLLHDIGKPFACTEDLLGGRHFPGHAKYSAQIAEKILRRLRFSADFIKKCTLLIFWHDIPLNGSKKQLRRLMCKIGEENVRLLFKIQRADKAAQSEYMQKEKLETLALAQEAFNQITSEALCFSLKDLNINGRDLMELGVRQGKDVGRLLDRLLGAVMDEKIPNERQQLLKLAKALVEDKAQPICQVDKCGASTSSEPFKK